MYTTISATTGGLADNHDIISFNLKYDAHKAEDLDVKEIPETVGDSNFERTVTRVQKNKEKEIENKIKNLENNIELKLTGNARITFK